MRRKIIITLFMLILTAAYLPLSCASNKMHFNYSEPVWHQNDTLHIPVPQKTNIREFDETLNITVRRPVVNALEFSRTTPSRDVNSLDEVPSSSWFNPRLGYKDISPQDLLEGPFKDGPPIPPLKIIEGKFSGLTPGFVVEDSRGIQYLFKFDPPDFPDIETAADFIVNRLFWGFGYNVPEDYLFHFNRSQLSIDRQSGLTAEYVDSIFNHVAPPDKGTYRCTASKMLKGIILGPFPSEGVREDDPNDRIKHENRRILRGLKVFGAFTNYTDLRIENTLDIYVGDRDDGYVKHYLLDFGGSLGAFSADKSRLWGGANHLFSFKEMTKNLLTAGLVVEDWEKLEYTPWKSVGAFEADKFKPENWKETYPFTPIHQSQPTDDYWAAKILGALNKDHLQILVNAADFPEDDAAEYVLNTLLKRRSKTLRYFLTRVSPLEPTSLSDGELHVKDMSKLLLGEEFNTVSYKIKFSDAHGNKLDEMEIINNSEKEFSIPVVNSIFKAGQSYLRISIRSFWKEKPAPTSAQIHLIKKQNEAIVVAGVIH